MHALKLRFVAKKPRNYIYVKWLPPAEGFIQINSDGSASHGQIQGGCLVIQWGSQTQHLQEKWGNEKHLRQNFWPL